MKSATIGDESIEISEITLGLWNLSGDDTWGDQQEQAAINTIHEAIDVGITTFDNAEMYGDGYAEELLGRALKSVNRERVTIASKVTPDSLRYDDVIESCNQSLERMNTDYLDIYYIHWPNRDVPFAETLRALAALKREGKIREVAISNFGPKDIERIFATIERKSIDVYPVLNQVPYNLLFRAIEYDIIPQCAAYDVGITTYSSLLHGILTGKFESLDDVPDERARTRHFSKERPGTTHGESGVEELTKETLDSVESVAAEVDVPMEQLAIAWNLAQPHIESVIVGARSPEQVRQNAAATDVSLKDETVEQLNSITQDLKDELGPNPDMWQSNSRYQ